MSRTPSLLALVAAAILASPFAAHFAAPEPLRPRLTHTLRPVPTLEPAHSETRDGAPVAAAPALARVRASLVATSLSVSDSGSPAFSDVSTWQRSQRTAHDATLMTGDDTRLPLEALQIHARVDGFRARVLVDLFFFQDGYSTVEGRLKLRLPDGASPFYLAFGATELEEAALAPTLLRDPLAVRHERVEPEGILAARARTWDSPVEARMVTREDAGFAYRETVRREVDPALLEWAGPNVFSASLFPLEPRALHHVVVGYDVDLVPVGHHLEARIDVPEGLAHAVVDVDVAELPHVKISFDPPGESETVEGRRAYRLENASGRAVVVRQDVVGNTVLTGRDPLAGAFFAARVQPAIPASELGGGAREAVFLVDTSLSANPDQLNVWLAMFEAILRNNRDAGGIERFALAFFDVETRWWQPRFVANTDANIDAALTTARTLTLEGATDLRVALAQAAHPAWLDGSASSLAVDDEPSAPWDVFLLSDATVTWGEDDRFALARTLTSGHAGPLYAYRTGVGPSDQALLAHLARQSGGGLFAVTGESEVAAASRAHRARPWRLESVQTLGGSDLVVAGAPYHVYPGQALLIVGRGALDRDALLTLTLRQAGDEQPRVVTVAVDHQLESPLALRAYGEVVVSLMDPVRQATGGAAAAYARHFRVVGPSASLLMLETEEDYSGFGIASAEDDRIVRERLARSVLDDAFAALGADLGDPQAAFVAWVDRLASTRGLNMFPSPTYRELLVALPSSVFEVPESSLHRAHPFTAGAPDALRATLASGEPEESVIREEARRRLEDSGPDDALIALSTLVEAHAGDAVVARDVAFVAMEWGLHAQAYQLLRRVAYDRPYEPQSVHGMALAAAEMGRPELAMALFELGLSGRWDSRFGEFDRILAVDYARFLRAVERGTVTVHHAAQQFAAARLPEVLAQVDLDKVGLVITLAWSTDRTDVDLHVVEPTGEECFYSHPKTALGGEITRDVTQGFGPEMYVLRRPKRGTYAVKAKYYAEDSLRTSTLTRAYVTVYEGWGTAEERVTRRAVALEGTGDMQLIAELEVDRR